MTKLKTICKDNVKCTLLTFGVYFPLCLKWKSTAFNVFLQSNQGVRAQVNVLTMRFE